MRVSIPLALALAAVVCVAACSKKSQRRGEEGSPSQSQPQSGSPQDSTQTAETEPTASPTVQALPTPEPTPRRNSYLVKPGDSLWTIAGRKDVQGDHFRWPLLFKANRDQILDPDLIEPQQDLTWKPSYTSDEVEDAKAKAGDTPRYKPHRKPRKLLPLKY